jgi:glutamate racemase
MIGIFDSGLGGLVFARAIHQYLPDYNLAYLGDTLRLPYGNRSQDFLYTATQQGVSWLFEHGCQLVIVACNSASAEALRRLQQEWLPTHYPDRRVLGVIRPIAEAAAATTKTGRVGVIGTRATITSGAYGRELEKLQLGTRVIEQATPLLVPLIEEGWAEKPETMRVVRAYLRPLKTHQIDTLVLGCTHYPILLKQIRAVCGKRIVVPDPAEIVAERLVDYLKRHPEIDQKLQKQPGAAQCEFFVTDTTPTIAHLATKWFGPTATLTKVTIA